MKAKSLKLNFIMNAILTMSSFIFPLITWPYVSRVLMPEGTGKVSFATSVVSYFSMFAQLGIPTYGIRACARVRDDKEKLNKVVHELLRINCITTIISYTVFICVFFIVPSIACEKPLFLIVSATILFNAIGVEWLYKALEQYSYITIRSIIFKFIALVGMFGLVHSKEDYVIYGFLTIFAASASNILNFINLHRYVNLNLLERYDIKVHLKPVLVFFSMSVATNIYTHLDTVMLGFMTSNIDVGYYNAAVKIKVILVSIVTSLGTVLLPRASSYVEQGKQDEFIRITEKALNFELIFAAPLSLYFILFAKNGIYFLSGNMYSGAVVPMQIIMPTLLLIGISNITGIQILVPMGKEKIVLYSEIAGACVDLVLNIILIPKFASSGAAFGTLAAELAVLMIQMIALRKFLSESIKKINFSKILIALILGALGSIWVKMLSIGSFFTLFISALCFFGVYGTILLVLKEPLINEMFGHVLGLIKRKKFNDTKER